MEEAIEKAKEELKRVDHLFYVSLKYTKTVDVIKSTIERLINVFEFSIEGLFLYMKMKKKVKDIPTNPIASAIEIKKLFKDDKQFIEDVDLYLLLRKATKAKYECAREFRKHVTMITGVDKIPLNIKIDSIEEYYKRAKNFVEKANILIFNIKEE